MGKTYDPAEIQEEVITPECDRFLDRFDSFIRGTDHDYDNIHMVVEESLWDAFNAGFNMARKRRK